MFKKNNINQTGKNINIEKENKRFIKIIIDVNNIKNSKHALYPKEIRKKF